MAEQAKNDAPANSSVPAAQEELFEIDHDRIPEEEDSNIFTFPLYTWASSMFSRGYTRAQRKEPLDDDDILKLPANEQASPAYAAFCASWKLEQEMAAEAVKEWEAQTAGQPADKIPPRPQPRIFRALLRSCGKFAIFGGVLRFICDSSTIASPFLLREFINWIGKFAFAEDSVDKWKGFAWCFAVALNQLIYSLCLHTQYHFTCKSASASSCAGSARQKRLSTTYGKRSCRAFAHFSLSEASSSGS